MSTSSPAKPRLRLPLLRWLRKGKALVVISIAALALIIVHSAWFRETDLVRHWEGQAHDARFHQRGTLPPHPDVVIVGMKSSSFDKKNLEPFIEKSEALRLMYDNPAWPWPRSIHALVVERLLEAGAKVVAIDIVFAASKAEDEALSAVMKKYPGRVVLASTVQSALATETVGNHEIVFQRANGALLEAAGPESEGFVTYDSDKDGIHRRFDYRTSEVREHPRLSMYMDDLRDLWKFAPLAVHKFNGAEQPSDYGQVLNFSGPAQTFRSYPVEELFMENSWADPVYRHGEAFRGKLVFYGPIAEIMHDTMDTPYGNMPGVEVHAQLAANLLRGDFIKDASQSCEWLIATAAVTVVVLLVLLVAHAALQAAAIFSVVALFWYSTQLAFTKGLVLVPTVPSVVSIGLTGALSIVFLFLLEQLDKAKTRKVLNQFVSKKIAAVILKNAETFQSGRPGNRRPVAIVFSDIRGFTTWSESAVPEHLVGQMNEYFQEMVENIESLEGNAQKFIGDAILAAWGDTVVAKESENARHAVMAALQMRASLKKLNAGWANREDRRVISIGIGINCGDVIVGEVGHPERREFTVLGDGVNFAARLESATKQFHTDCLVGERVEQLTREHFIFRHVDNLRVKGKTKPVNVYTLISDRSVPPPAWLEDYHTARVLYMVRRFDEAAELFRQVKVAIGGEDFLCDMYAERCDRYASEPPPADWDGSYTMTEK